MTRDMIISIYDSIKNPNFPKYDMDAWVNSEVYDELSKEFKCVPFVRVESSRSLNNFKIEVPLQRLNKQNKYSSNSVYLNSIYHKTLLPIEDGLSVKVIPINIDNLPISSSVIIKLPEEEVSTWSDYEVDFCKNSIPTQYIALSKDQPLWVRPETSKKAMGIVISIRDARGKEINGSCQITKDTIIHFEGLDKNRQKTIDFEKIGGLSHIIKKLREIIQIPLQYPELLDKFSISPPKGLLLYGPPGNGKTMIARAVSQSLGAKFFTIEGSEGLSKYVGESENFLRKTFENAEKSGDSVIFIDEIDSIARARSHSSAGHEISIVSTLLNLMDGMASNSRTFVIAATNRLNSIDSALRRPGRFDLEMEVPLPEFDARKDILSKYIDFNNSNIVDINLDEQYIDTLASLTNGFSGADLSSLYRESAMSAIRKSLKFNQENGKIDLVSNPDDICINKDDFEYAFKQITPTSRRGEDNNTTIALNWDNFNKMSVQKKYMEDINKKIIDSEFLDRRPIELNLVIYGEFGKGKNILISSFCREFGYELIDVWLPELLAKELGEAYEFIEFIYTKAKQLMPSLVYFENSELLVDDKSKLILAKIHKEEEKLHSQHKVLSIIEWNSSQKPPNYLCRKRFKKLLKF